jgi:hypothetical protein
MDFGPIAQTSRAKETDYFTQLSPLLASLAVFAGTLGPRFLEFV